MKRIVTILFLFVLLDTEAIRATERTAANHFFLNFYGDTIDLPGSSGGALLAMPLSDTSVQAFCDAINTLQNQSIADSLAAYKRTHQLADWVYYQLVRAAAGQISPKAANYYQYTLYKWYFLTHSGYNATVSICGSKILLYIQCEEDIYDVPAHSKAGKQYVCLNYHDYGTIDFDKEKFIEVPLFSGAGGTAFSYKITSLPDFKLSSYQVRELQFDYYQQEYTFKVLVNRQVEKIFSNYPVVDFGSYFNVPVSKATYSSLIPVLKNNVKKLNQKDGVDYLMRFTRYAFPFESDTQAYGKERRLTPEQTLLTEFSDCEDRAAFFFYLVKEIYDLPMIAIAYPKHVTIAVKFDKPIGKPIAYKGEEFSICDATPQSTDLPIGQTLYSLRNTPFDVVYEYHPQKPAKAVSSNQ